VRDFARHQELQRIARTRVSGEVHQPLVHDLGTRLRRNVAAKINIQLAGNLQVVPIEL
jgi:hypothetical protein